jgi:serine/threonine-protein kinase
VWVDRQGHEEPLPVPMRAYLYPQLSPDGTKLAVDVRDEDNDVWIWDLVRSSLRRFTFDRAIDGAPVWSPDGTRLVFSSNRGTTARGANIFSQAADGTGAVQQLTTGTTSTKYAAAFTPDGRRLVFSDEGAATTTLADLMVMPLDGERKPETLLQTEFREFNAALSPDGKWIAYQVRESSRYEVYVRPFPEVQRGRWQISTDGGEQPLWSRDGREIFYLNPEGKLMSVSVQTTPTFVAQTPRPVFDKSYVFDITANSLRTYDVSRDGRRFLMIKNVELPEQAAVPQVVLILNWSEELKRRLPSN